MIGLHDIDCRCGCAGPAPADRPARLLAALVVLCGLVVILELATAVAKWAGA